MGAITQQATGNLEVRTTGRGLFEVTTQVADWLAHAGVRHGLLTLFLRHTSASLRSCLEENRP